MFQKIVEIHNIRRVKNKVDKDMKKNIGEKTKKKIKMFSG